MGEQISKEELEQLIQLLGKVNVDNLSKILSAEKKDIIKEKNKETKKEVNNTTEEKTDYNEDVVEHKTLTITEWNKLRRAKAKSRTKVCPICGEEYTVSRGNHKTCGNKYCHEILMGLGRLKLHLPKLVERKVLTDMENESTDILQD